MNSKFAKSPDARLHLLDRRCFLRFSLKAAAVFLGGSLFPSIPVRKAYGALQGVSVVGSFPYKPHYSMVIRQHKCIDCELCMKACAQTNDLPSYGYRTIVLERDIPPASLNKSIEFMPVLCNQCNRPPCVKVCPTKATFKDKKTGIVMMNEKLCIGCKACMASCPYNARYYNKEQNAVDKCDFCFKARLSKGEPTPACVEACPADVLLFGDLADQNSEISKLVRNQGATVWALRPELGTMPNVFYLKD